MSGYALLAQTVIFWEQFLRFVRVRIVFHAYMESFWSQRNNFLKCCLLNELGTGMILLQARVTRNRRSDLPPSQPVPFFVLFNLWFVLFVFFR